MGERNGGFDYRERIGPESEGRSVLAHLVARHRHSSAAQWNERLGHGQLFLDGVVAGASVVLRTGQCLVWRRPGWEEPAAPLEFEVLFEDEHLLAVGKPRGLPTIPGAGFLTHSLTWLVRQRTPEAAPMHRLDRAASGIVLFARTRRARTEIGAAWRRGEVCKGYRALVAGVPEADEFEVRQPIGLVPRQGGPPVHAACVQGKHAHSKVKVIARREDRALVEVELCTGRPHQIRIHLAAAGHPLWGDPLYREGGLPAGAARPGDGGFLLHAQRLALFHPIRHVSFEIYSPPPSDLR